MTSVRVLALAVIVAACEGREADPVPHVRLGMAPRDVRAKFEPGGEGTWRTSLGGTPASDDTAVEWASKAGGTAAFATVRFEFHLGMLVAMRARTTEASAKETIATTPKTVTVRAPAPEGGTSLTVLARDCPTHKEEAEGLVRRALR